MNASSAPAVELDRVSKRYAAGARTGLFRGRQENQELWALRDVTLRVEPDVLLVDEVLSVGDVAFQDRSIRKMLSFRDSGQTVLFVSHNLSAVEMMCGRTVWLDHGRIRLVGATAEVVRAYLDAVDST